MKLILTRHGETEENIAGIMQGHLPDKLSDSGIEQAKSLALRLKDEKIEANKDKFNFATLKEKVYLVAEFPIKKQIIIYGWPNEDLSCF